jgi:DNA polymerase III subunit epsilon
MIFAVTDIETTGGKPGRDGMTEIAIVLTDGTKILDQFSSLINPQTDIPPTIVRLTGITPEMVENEPLFEDLADQIFEKLQNAIFVAHNVNFDLSWVKYCLQKSGYKWNPPRICTVKTSRKLLPGFASYSLGKLCESLEIPLENRHRALGDALATTHLFHKMIETHGMEQLLKHVEYLVKLTDLPPNLTLPQIQKIPDEAGLLEFWSENQRLWCKGTSRMHQTALQFAQKRPSKPAQKIYEQITEVRFTATGNSIIAILLEKSIVENSMPPGMKRSPYPAKLQVVPKLPGIQLCLLGQPVNSWIVFNQGQISAYGLRDFTFEYKSPIDMLNQAVEIKCSSELTHYILRSLSKETHRFVTKNLDLNIH